MGSIFGSTNANDTVRVENVDTGQAREIQSDAKGQFTFNQLAPGRYKVVSAGKTREVVVAVGTGTSVSFAEQADNGSLDTVVVTGKRSFNPIDVGSVESTTVFTREQIQQLPVANNTSSIALMAPSTTKGDTSFGNLASFGGASVAENGYYINGFDVTNLRTMLSFARVPFEANDQYQIKTGGYGSEYGRSLGGVVSIVTKRGTNEWKGGASLYWTPSSLSEPGKDVLTRVPGDAADPKRMYLIRRSPTTSDTLKANVFAGGPIIKDKMFFYGLLEVERSDYNDFGSSETSYRNYRPHTPNALAKIDWNITDSHILELTGIYNKTVTQETNYRFPTGTNFGTSHGDETSRYDLTSGGYVGIAKYTGFLTDTFTVSAQVGRLYSERANQTPQSLPGGECVYARYFGTSNASVKTGCYNDAQTYIRDPNSSIAKDYDQRTGFRIDGEWLLGSHQLRFGIDQERFESGAAGLKFSGGIYWAHYQVPTAGRLVNGVSLPGGTKYAREQYYESLTGSYLTKNSAIYLEDNWRITNNFLLYVGLRSESFENFTSSDIPFVSAKHQLAPRLGFSWDVKGDSTFKMYGSAGRFYIPVAGSTNSALSNANVTRDRYYYTTGYDAATGLPTGQGAQIGATVQNNPSIPPVAPHPSTLSALDLKPMYQDEVILGIQMQLNPNWTFGLRGVKRKVRNGMDDYCGTQAFVDWAADNGYTAFNPNSLARCVILNPGRDLQLAVDVNNSKNPTPQTISNKYLQLPNYVRNYSALELTSSYVGSRFNVQASYTYAKSTGNMEGYVNSSLNQSAPGRTQDFDHKLFTDGGFGYLPNDRRHTFKLYGSLKLTEELRVGMGWLVQSGRAVSCQGYIPLNQLKGADVPKFTGYGTSSFYCVQPDGSYKLTNRGAYGRTPWLHNLDASIQYRPQWLDDKVLVKLDIFNVLNKQGTLEYLQSTQLSRNDTYIENGVTKNIMSPNFLLPAYFQSPRSVALTVRYDF